MQGAESTVIVKNGLVIKSRVKKKYRDPRLDKQIRKRRNKREIKVYEKCYGLGINVPKIISKGDYSIELEYLESPYNKNHKKLAEQINKLHENGIIHGDFTPKNVLSKNNECYLIDFGLSFFSDKIEDMATDLHQIEKTFENHKEIIESYMEISEKSKEISDRLNIIKKRGRNK